MIKLLMNRRLREYHGVDSEAIFSGIGEQIGHALARKLTATDLTGVLDELVSMWDNWNLGYIEVVETFPLIFKLRECYDCLDYSKDGKKAFMAFDRMLLQTILRDRLGLQVKVSVTETCQDNASPCVYEIHLSLLSETKNLLASSDSVHGAI